MISFYTFSYFKDISSCQHAITTKSNDEPYKCSLALHTNENPIDIIHNRNNIISHLKWNKNVSFVVANQTHSDHITIINDNKHRGWLEIDDAIEDCDALISNKKDIVLTILTADCVPILLYDKEKNVVAAVHAGWKGTKAEILAKTIYKMTEVFDSNPKDIFAGIGPSIGVCCYEVGLDVATHFKKIPQAYVPKIDKFMLDLPMINKQQLLSAGLLEANIEMSGICTSCEVDSFFSYRKETGCSGRFMSMIGLA